MVPALMVSAVARWRGWYGAHPLHLLAVLGALALADRGLLATLRRVRRRRGLPRVPVVNHIRVPVLGSGLLLLVFFPVIVQQGEQTYVAATGLTMDPYLERWLLLSGAMFLISALGYGLRLARARSAVPPEGPG